MPNFNEIPWDNVTLPKGVTREQVVKDYEDNLDVLKRMNREFVKYFSNKRRKAKTQMMTLNIFEEVQGNVGLLPNGIIDVQGLLQFISNDDRPLFADVCKFLYQYYEGLPMNTRKLNQFRGLLTYYLCKVGF